MPAVLGQGRVNAEHGQPAYAGRQRVFGPGEGQGPPVAEVSASYRLYRASWPGLPATVSAKTAWRTAADFLVISTPA
jgi:hypothetical protein